MDRNLKVVLALPGEAEMPLLTELRTRDDVDIVAVVDPTGETVGAAIAEIMGIPVLADVAALTAAEGMVASLDGTMRSE